MSNNKNHIYIGYDEREKDPYSTLIQSLKDNSKDPDRIVIHPLFHRDLRTKGYFDRPWTIKEDGTYLDNRDERPFSVQFSHSRFLTPWLARKEGINDDMVMFVDCDFIFLKDVNDLFDAARLNKEKNPVQVVKHNYHPQNQIKMDGSKQQDYNMKLWSSLMMFNTGNKEVVKLDPTTVNYSPGSYLHQFKWLDNRNIIGDLGEEWNYIPRTF